MRTPVSRILAGAGFVIFLAIPFSARAQQKLPPAIPHWVLVSVEVIQAAALESVAEADAAILREYGILNAERRDYGKERASLRVVFYRMKDTTAAYGAYTFLRTDEMTPVGAGSLSAASAQAGRALALHGSWVVELTAFPARDVSSELRAVLDALAVQPDQTPLPSLPRYLPEAGKVRNTERYLLGPKALERFLPVAQGDWAGFALGGEAEIARYRVNGQDLTLLLIAYPTPQAASQKLAEMSRQFDVGGLASDGRSDLYAKRSLGLLVLVLGASSQQTADALLRQVNPETQVTWNEPGHHATERFDLMLKTVFIGTATVSFFFVVASIAFGGFRLFIKKILPGKVFDRPSTIEVLQLGLGSKPIDAKDFYTNA